MPGTTPNYLLPTMLGTDPLGTVAERITALATRLDGTPFGLLGVAAGWTGNIRWIRRSGIVVVTMIGCSKASWANNEVIGGAALPVGSRPPDVIVSFGVDSNNSPRPFYVDTAGVIKAAGANTGAITGTLTFAPVA